MKKNISWKPLLFSVALSLGAGALSGYLAGGSRELYSTLEKPPLSPPGWVFPVVWSLLYVLMGISAYLVWKADTPKSEDALLLYAVQLAVNFVWPLLFFNGQRYLLALVWLLLLWVLVALMTVRFWRIDKTAGLLLLPYLAWLTFAAYLNLGVWLLNR